MTTSERIDTDVVVVGSGMGGGTTAWALAKKGVKVLIVERGGRIAKEEENWSPSEVFIKGRYKNSEDWLDLNDKPFQPGVHYYVGGNTKLYGAALPRFSESDYEETQHLEGISPAWPFTYKQFEPYYCKAEELYKVHGPSEDQYGAKKSKPFPFPAIENEPYVAELAARLKKAGVNPHGNSMGIDMGAGGKCIRCKTCDGFICKVDSKSDSEVNAVNPALATGNASLMMHTKVTRVVLDAAGKKVDHLLAEKDGKEIKIYAKKYVLSLGAVNTAALLLRSGVANSSDQVGRNYMMHVNSHLAAIDFRRKNNDNFQKTISFTDWYLDGGKGYPLGTFQMIGKVQGIMMKSFATKVPLFILNFISKYSVECLIMNEDFPDPNNRVTITPSGQIKLARVPNAMKTHMELLKRVKGLLHKIGYIAVFRQPFNIAMNAHQCGTLKAGHDPKTSVVDQYCKSHDHDNLYLIDGGFFPSSAAMNPALTIAAQAIRVVEESDLANV